MRSKTKEKEEQKRRKNCSDLFDVLIVAGRDFTREEEE